MRRCIRCLHTPRGLKNVPVPRTASKIADIKKAVGEHGVHEHEHAPSPLTSSAYVESLFVPQVDAAKLVSPANASRFHVQRTRTGHLPVYTDYNNAGGVWTEVRKVSGDVSALRNQLHSVLNLNKKDIWIKDASKVIVIKGNVSALVKKHLAESF